MRLELGEQRPRPAAETRAELPRRAPAAPEERELLEVLLAEPSFVTLAAQEVNPDQLKHLGLRRLLQELYRLQAAGHVPDLDQIRLRIDNPELAEHALLLEEKGRMHANRRAWFERLLAIFSERRLAGAKQEIRNQLQAASDHDEALELLRR